jgi:hypothetical protein
MPKPSTEKHARAPSLDQPSQLALVGDPDVEVAVGAEDHAVDAAAMKFSRAT